MACLLLEKVTKIGIQSILLSFIIFVWMKSVQDVFTQKLSSLVKHVFFVCFLTRSVILCEITNKVLTYTLLFLPIICQSRMEQTFGKYLYSPDQTLDIEIT